MELNVNLGPRSYPIVLDENIAGSLPERLKRLFPKARFGLVTNDTIYGLYEKQVREWKTDLDLTVHIMPDGEQHKNIETWGRIFDTMLSARLERSSVILSFGGGVVGDMAGFAAAALLRGVAYVQVPTTLLAMVDSSVGGKTGLDHSCGKNLIGAFHQPRLVFIDTAFLKTLPEREYLAGYAELFKYAFIGGRSMFDFIATNHDKLLAHEASPLLEGIKRSIEIKAGIVEQDEFEIAGRRMLLNFGHTFAHALEKHFGFGPLLHGEAVWHGMACACELGKILKTIPENQIAAYDGIIAKMGKPKLPSVPSANDLYKAMFHDKKVSGGSIRFVVPAEPGTSIVKTDVPDVAVKETIKRVFSDIKT
jgi:3-dehydroquinate synthase